MPEVDVPLVPAKPALTSAMSKASHQLDDLQTLSFLALPPDAFPDARGNQVWTLFGQENGMTWYLKVSATTGQLLESDLL